MNTKNVQNQLEVSKETIVTQQIDKGSKTLLNMLRLPSQIQRGWSRRKGLRLTFDLIDIESGRIVKLPWVNLTSPKAGKQQIEKIEIMQYSKAQCVGKCFANWCNGYDIHN